jgi:large subunit ribosomal protein L32e
MRRKLSGRPRSVEAGYSSPKAIRGVHPSGFREVLVHNPKDLEKVTAGEAVRIAHTVGLRKKLAILQKADELNLRVLNPVGVGETEFEEPEETGL